MIDDLDRKILVQLSENCRQSINQVARRLKRPKNTIAYRISRLEKDGIIAKYQAITDFSKMGLNYARFAIKLFNNSASEHDKAIKKLASYTKIIWLASTQGRIDIIFVLLYKDIAELTAFNTDMKKAIGNNIENIHLSLLDKLHTCSNNMVSGSISPPTLIEYTQISDHTDELDKKILSVLQQDAKTGIITIAKKAKCNEKTALYRLKNLKDRKIIKKFTIEIDYGKLGLDSYHIFWRFYTMDHDATIRFRNYLLEMKETQYISESIGSISSFDSDMLAKNNIELYGVVNRLKEQFPEFVKDFEILTMIKVHRAF